MKRRTAVIGAGPAGSYAAHLLQQKGREVVVYEQAKTVGGRTAAWNEQGWVVDSGAGFFTNFYPILWSLIEKLNLSHEVTQLSRCNALTDGTKTVDFTLGSPASFARFPLLTAGSKLRMALQTAFIIAKYGRLNLSSPASLAPWDDVSVRDDAVHRLGERAYQYLVRPGIEPFWFFSCENISRSLMLALQAKAATAKFYTFKQGMNFICTRLASDLDVRTGITASSIQASGSRFIIRGDGLPDGPQHAFDEVVIATTGNVASRLVSGLDESLVPEKLRKFLDSQTYVQNTHAVYLVENRARLPKISTLLPCGPKNHRVAGVNFNSYKQQTRDASQMDHEAVSVYLTAAESAATSTWAEADLYRHMWSLARTLVPQLPEHAKPLQIIRRQNAIPLHEVGRYRAAAEVAKVQKAPIVFAGDYLATATVDGAFHSGFEAACNLEARVAG